MKFIIIDDNKKYAERLLVQLKEEGEVISSEGKVLNELANEFQGKANDQNDVVLLININLKAKNKNRQEQAGIELLIWLRIKEVLNHVVLYSFETLHSLLNRKFEHLIAASRGTTIIQMPNDFQKLDLVKLRIEKADEDNLKKALRPAFDIFRFRHAYANVWGLKRLMEVHNYFFNRFDKKLIKLDIEITTSLEYNVAEYIFKRKSLQIDKKFQWDINRALDDLEAKLKSHSDINILFIDDKAGTGWKALLESLLGKAINTLTIKDIKTDNLIAQFEALKNIDIIISDLRLYPEEEKVLDYNDFKSIKLLKYIFDKKERGRLVYKNLRYVLFTASNQLLNYKNLIKSNKYVPSGIFIKEGFDFYINDHQQEQNYLNLINTLIPAIAESYNKKGARIETANPQELQVIERIEKESQGYSWKSKTNDIKVGLSNYDHVFLDTNVFLHKDPCIGLSESNNIKCIYPVYKELERIASTREQTYRVWIGSKVLENYKDCVSTEFLTKEDILEIDNRFADGKNLKDYADGFFLPIIQEIYYTDNAKKILFITGDTKIGSPYQSVKNWVRESNNSDNIKVYSIPEFYAAHDIFTKIEPRKGTKFVGSVKTFYGKEFKSVAIIKSDQYIDVFLHINNCGSINPDRKNIDEILSIGQKIEIGVRNVFFDKKQGKIKFEIEGLRLFPNTP